MLVFGEGSLVYRFVSKALAAGAHIEMVVIRPSEILENRLDSLSVRYLTTDSFNTSLQLLTDCVDSKTAVAINCSEILSDKTLAIGLRFINFHNGLVQHYRGRAEICVLDAICADKRVYGATCQLIEPRRHVDMGRVAIQSRFYLDRTETFESLMRKSIANLETLFDSFLQNPDLRGVEFLRLNYSESALSYRDVKVITANTDEETLGRAFSLGVFSELFPRLRALSIGGSFAR